MTRERPNPAGATQKDLTLPARVEERIRQIEEKYDLLKYQVDGWCVWPTLRYGMARLLANDQLRQRNQRRGLARLVLSPRDVSRLIAPRRARYVIKTQSSGLLDQENGFYKDIWFDDLLQEIGHYFKIEGINNPDFIARRETALIKSDLTTMPFDVAAAVLTPLGGPSHIFCVAQELSACLRNELGSLSPEPIRLQHGLLYHYWSKKLYTWLLKRIHSAYLLIEDAHASPLVPAAKELGIQVIEFQHGIISRHCSEYSWSTYALDYKAKMPIPDYLFLYGEYWKKELDVNGFWGESLRVVGSPRLDHYRELRSVQRQDQCLILVTAQGLGRGPLISFLADFAQMAEGRLKFRLVIKLHPVYETDKEPYLAAFRGNQSVQVLLGTEGPSVLELLGQADFHISIASAAHLEALGLGVPTIVLPFTTHEFVLPLVEAGHALLAHTPQELLSIVSQGGRYTISDVLSDFLFKTGAIENMKRELGLEQAV